MPDLDYAKVTGRLALTVGDSVDVGEDPDTIWCDEGTVRIKPLNTYTKVAGATPVPFTAGHAVIDCTVDSEGYLTYNGQRQVYVVDLTSPKVNPQIGEGLATHEVTFLDVKAGGTPVAFAKMEVRLTTLGPESDGENDLTIVSPVPSGSATPIIVGPQGTGIADAEVNGAGNLLLTLTDATVVDAGVLPVGPGGSDAGVAGYIGTPGSATEVALSATFVGYDLLPSGDATGATDTAALQPILAAVASGLREKQITLTPAIYYFDDDLVFPSGTRIRCFGGGMTGGAEWGAVLRYVGGPIARFIDARNMIGGTLEGLVMQGGGTFAGTVCDLEGAQFVNVTDCVATGQGSARPARGFDLKNANQITFTRTNFASLVDCVRGLSAPAGQFASIIRFYDCNFGSNGGGEITGKAIRNPNTNWMFSACNFQPDVNGAPCAVGFDSTSYPWFGLKFSACQFEDITAAYLGSTAWLELGTLNGAGLSVDGGSATMGTDAPFARWSGAGTREGFKIKGINANAVPGGTSSTFVDMGGGGTAGVEVAAIGWHGTWADGAVSGTPGSGSIIQQPRGGCTTYNYGGLLASKQYNPSGTNVFAFGVSDADLDAANLSIPIIVPPSGKVKVSAELLLLVESDSTIVLSLRIGATAHVTGRSLVWPATGYGFQYRGGISGEISGLTPGAAVTIKLGGYKSGAGASSYGYGTGNQLGPFTIDVAAA